MSFSSRFSRKNKKKNVPEAQDIESRLDDIEKEPEASDEIETESLKPIELFDEDEPQADEAAEADDAEKADDAAAPAAPQKDIKKPVYQHQLLSLLSVKAEHLEPDEDDEEDEPQPEEDAEPEAPKRKKLAVKKPAKKVGKIKKTDADEAPAEAPEAEAEESTEAEKSPDADADFVETEEDAADDENIAADAEANEDFGEEINLADIPDEEEAEAEAKPKTDEIDAEDELIFGETPAAQQAPAARQSDAEKESEPETEPEAETESEPEEETETEAPAAQQSDDKADSEPETEPDAETEPESEAEAESKPEEETEPAEAAETEAETAPEPKELPPMFHKRDYSTRCVMLENAFDEAARSHRKLILHRLIYLFCACVICAGLTFGISQVITNGVSLPFAGFAALPAAADTEILEGTVSPGYGEPAEPNIKKAIVGPTDPSLWSLVLCNVTHPLPENYEAGVTYITPFPGVSEQQCDARIEQPLKDMFAAAEADGIYLYFRSGYRSHELQTILFDAMQADYMAQGMTEEEALAATKRLRNVPGTSEHETGLAVDLVPLAEPDMNLVAAFANYPEAKWLLEHCAEYGFILRYPQDKTEITGTSFEPWHFRYVGIEDAKKIMEQDICLEEYLGEA